ncbi:peptidase [Roseivivax halodurans JCM 10272]|uniref:Peptidase n=1 Tax=Roseivivax halodurans JCM 10272 TaxID=1449350 RepID=X7E9P0_9RHOB|nr:AAA family ATPase [Roseivivax halodurans]ETX12804.1 peptidase [Roseivivax halodurans JCM 10272]
MPKCSKIPFARVRFYEDIPKLDAVEMRLQRFLKDLRIGRQNAAISAGRISEDDKIAPHEIVERREKIRIANRAMAYLERVHASTGMDHLSKEDRARLVSLRHGLPITGISDEHEADTIAARLHDEMPWMDRATEHVWHAMRRSVRQGEPGFRFPALLLVGPPGIGKSFWARRFGEFLERPTTKIEATSEPASFSIVGSQRGWSTGEPGKVVTTILRERSANPIVVVDEVEKAGDVTSNRGIRFSITDALLPLLEVSTAATWQCPYYRIQFDMSWIGWVLTANSSDCLPEPLLSRCPPLTLSNLSREHILRFARREAERRKLPETAIGAIEESLAAVSSKSRFPSLRTVNRMIDRAETIAFMPTIH